MRSRIARWLGYVMGVTSLVAAPAMTVAAAAAPAPAPGTNPVVLITGMRFGFVPGASGRPAPMALPGPVPQAMPVTGLRLAGRSLEIPADALPYLGRGLDPNLFDLAALSRLEHGGRLPVLVSYQGKLRALPGIRITGASAGTARGYLTAASALRFGAALRRQFAADHDRASYGTDGLFAGGVSIALAGAAAPRPAKRPVNPQFVMHTLTVHGTNLAGHPDNGDEVIVINVDDAARFDDLFAAFRIFDHGVVKFSVPAGHYWVIGRFLAGSLSAADEHQVVLPQVNVSNDQSVNVRERAASSEVLVTTPRPAVRKMTVFTMVRTPGQRRGQPSGFAEFVPPGSSLWVSPTRQKTTTGALRTFTQFQLASRADKPGVPYAYGLDFVGPAGLIPSQHFTVRQSRLATIDNRYVQDFSSTGGWYIAGGTRAEFGNSGLVAFGSVPLKLPGHLLEYVTASPEVAWSGTYFQFVDTRSGLPQAAGGQSDTFRSFRAGQQVSEDWNAGPLHPQPVVKLARSGPVALPPVPAAARVGDLLTLGPAVFSDNTTGHQGAGYLEGAGVDTGASPSVRGRFLIKQNGKTLASGNAADGLPQVTLSGRPSVVRFRLTAQRTDRRYDLSTASDTTWTWRSRPSPAAKVPAPWGCLPEGASASFGPYTRQCAVQPMLTLGYKIAGLRLDGATAPGRQVIGLSVGHLQLASAPAVARPAVRVSFNGGKTWHAAEVTRAGKQGQFTVAFTAPPKAHVTLRVTAADKAGGSVEETITSAYKTTAPAGPAHRIATAAARTGFIEPPCATPAPGQAGCFMAYRPQPAVNRALTAGQTSGPIGLSPADLRSAYNLPDQATSDQTVAVSIAFHTPGLAKFLATYRKQFGLPPCTVASGCFRQVNQQGNATPTEPSGAGNGWDLEATLDVSMISVACPHCKILVVEAHSPAEPNLAATETTAARLGAQVISNSYGAREATIQVPLEKDYSLPGHTIVASTGDLGYTAVQFPADLATVTAVGGTTLTKAPGTSRGWTEAAWNTPGLGAGGSGCSAWVAKPSWQHDPHCHARTVADIAAAASNVPIFNSAYGGWVTVAGTSVAAPLVAGIYGLAGNGTTMTTADLYGHPQSFFDITKGNNAFLQGHTPLQDCGGDYICVAKKGYDAPTGLGTPDGVGGF